MIQHWLRFPEKKALAHFTNSIGMKFVRVEADSFLMGQEQGGSLDERPVHVVTISQPFYMAATEVTNTQYEKFDPKHRAFRGKRDFSKENDEAVVFVSWQDAVRFCEWLSKKERRPYRLPTEAEWEYACRAGTSTPFHTGETLPESYHRNQETNNIPKPVSLKVACTPPNVWGPHDMHGNVEEWCLDWYGPYPSESQTDPVGYKTGEFKVTRGGSHNTPVSYLRSANRMGTLPEDKHWLIGFRVVLGKLPSTTPLSRNTIPLWARHIKQNKRDWHKSAHGTPYFEGPIPFVRKPEKPDLIPMHEHNHCPSITWCDNGDLLAVWFSTVKEKDREMTILASRLRAGQKQWDMPSEFFKAPDRNMTGSSLFNNGKGMIYHFNGLAEAGTWANLALVMRTSHDNGVTWQTKLISSHHGPHNQVISGAFRTRKGYLIQPCDSEAGSNVGTVLHISRDEGKTWADVNANAGETDFQIHTKGRMIAGIHAGVVELRDGSFLAFGRWGKRVGYEKDGLLRMPKSISRDMGKTWEYSASEFPPINGGQRLVLMRLLEGPLLFASFTSSFRLPKDQDPLLQGIEVTDAAGKKRIIFGLFAALSFDEGQTWPVKRLITDDGPGQQFESEPWIGTFVINADHSEPKGYLAATQTPDGIIHLISSALHYRFNLAWLKEPMPSLDHPQTHPIIQTEESIHHEHYEQTSILVSTGKKAKNETKA